MKPESVITLLIILVVILAVCVCFLALRPNSTTPEVVATASTEATQEPSAPAETTAPTSTATTTPATTEAAAETTAETTVETTEHEHDFHSKVTEAPTCSEKGERTYTCECGESYEEEIDELPHAFSITTRKASCTDGGRTTYTCKNCGYSYYEDTSSALGHFWGNWNTVQEPTSTAPGRAERRCTRCDAMETTTLPALG